jgi:hypothetical protein
LVKSDFVNVFQAMERPKELKSKFLKRISVQNWILRKNTGSNWKLSSFPKAIFEKKVNQVTEGVDASSANSHNHSSWLQGAD